MHALRSSEGSLPIGQSVHVNPAALNEAFPSSEQLEQAVSGVPTGLVPGGHDVHGPPSLKNPLRS